MRTKRKRRRNINKRHQFFHLSRHIQHLFRTTYVDECCFFDWFIKAHRGRAMDDNVDLFEDFIGDFECGLMFEIALDDGDFFEEVGLKGLEAVESLRLGKLNEYVDYCT